MLLLLFLAAPAASQDMTARFDQAKLRERIVRLSSDEFQGRGPGTEGGNLATQYIAEQLKRAGAKPGNGKSYFQNVPMVGVKADPATKLSLIGANGTKSFEFGTDFVATTSAQTEKVSVDADLIFVGYGIEAPEYRWNDYKGPAEQYRGKVFVMLVNDPPATSAEPGLFGGKALTYYGRWTYKFEEAARRGAAGVILVHTTPSAGYGWNVVQTSNGNWRYEIERRQEDTTPFLEMKSWATEQAVGKMMDLAGLNLAKLITSARSRDFIPAQTGLKVKLDLSSEFKRFESPNVVGVIKGSDKQRSSEYVVYSAHWDHLGVGTPDSTGDKVFNGAYDNASGVASVLGIANVIAKLKKSERPRRSIFFLFPTAEEQGLLGAEYFATHPLVPLAHIAGNVNIDGVNFFGRTKDFATLGGERSSLDPLVRAVAAERGLTLEGDSQPEQGFFFRSDHFPLAKVGVPAVSLRHGDDFVRPLDGEALSFFKNYTAKYYHQVKDEFKPWWDMDAMAQNAEIGLALGLKIANDPAMPHYKDGDEFAAADRARRKQ